MQMWAVNSTPRPTATMTIMAGTALNLMPNIPMAPNHWTTMVAMTTTLMAAIQGFIISKEMARNTAARMQTRPTEIQDLRCRYCSQKVKGMPLGKFGRPLSSNF